jgi:hypothetical protein
MSKIIINGEEFNVSGKSIVVNGDSIMVDGVFVKGELTGIVKIQFEGDLASLVCHNAIINGSVKGNITAHNVDCGDVAGNVNARNVN